jgi:hypothetical protein
MACSWTLPDRLRCGWSIPKAVMFAFGIGGVCAVVET